MLTCIFKYFRDKAVLAPEMIMDHSRKHGNMQKRDPNWLKGPILMI